MASKKPKVLNKATEQRIKLQAIEETMILVGAYLMDELGYSEDKIVELWQGVERYSKAVTDNLVSLSKVCKIIEDETGLQVKRQHDNS